MNFQTPMFNIKYFILLTFYLILTGCASTPNVSLSPNFWKNPQHVKVSNDKKHHAEFYQEGSEGILDVVINNAVTNRFQAHLKNYKLAEFNSIKMNFVKHLRAHHIDAAPYQNIDISKLEPIKGNKKIFSERDYTTFATNIRNKLLIVSINQVGAVRPYYAFIPLGAPKAICSLTGRLIDLKNNHILWRYTSNVVMPVQGKWDQPPNYPNFNHALKQAIYLAQAQLQDQFFSGVNS